MRPAGSEHGGRRPPWTLKKQRLRAHSDASGFEKPQREGAGSDTYGNGFASQEAESDDSKSLARQESELGQPTTPPAGCARIGGRSVRRGYRNHPRRRTRRKVGKPQGSASAHRTRR